MNEKPLFSIIIPTYNGEKTIGKLLKKITLLKNNYSTEVIIIDSQSKDKTLSIVKKFKNKLNLKIHQIKKDEFNHGLTRNYGVYLSKGKFIWFLSQDAIPISKNILNYYLEDFSLNKKVVVVFGEHIPYFKTPLIQKVEIQCYWEKLNKLTDKKKLLICNGELIDKSKKKDEMRIRLSNVSAVYKKNFLLKYPFPTIKTGEDMVLGKRIIDLGLIKIYDRRCAVYHSHFFNIWDYYKRESEVLNLRLNILKDVEKINLLCKLRKIMSLSINPFSKTYYLVELFFYYLLKALIFFKLRFFK